MSITLVLGASKNPDRASNQVLQKLKDNGNPVVAVGNKEATVFGIPISKEFPNSKIDTVTMYLGAKNQTAYYEKIISLNPRSIIFNPGAENPELFEMANKKGIDVMNACTLVMLSIGNY